MTMHNESNDTKIGAALARAIRTNDTRAACAIVDRLRIRGWRYHDLVTAAQVADPSITVAAFEDLMAECDESDARS
jgi:hypothetical protein